MKDNPFAQPDYEADEKRLKDEEQRSGRKDWSEIFWKPQASDENLIRILPAKGGSGADYHLTYSIHFIKHQDRVERFICSRETYGNPCPACEQYFELVKDKETKKEAARYAVKRLGLFNIIDRSAVEPKVMLYECPQTAVWKAVLKLARALKKQKASLFDIHDEKGNLEIPGRDILITYDPEAEGVAMYSLMAAPVPEPLGTDEQIKEWSGQITPLVLAEIAPATDYEIAKIKTFSSREERDELRKQTAAALAAEQKDDEEEEKEEEKPKEKEKEKEEEKPKEKEAEKAEEKPKEKEEEKPKEKEKEKEEEKPKEKEAEKSKDETPDEVKEKIRKIRERAKQSKK